MRVQRVAVFALCGAMLAAASAQAAWESETRLDPFYDHEIHALSTPSQAFVDKHGRERVGRLALTCSTREGRAGLAVEFHFGGLFMSDSGAYGEITYRVDGKSAKTGAFETSNDHEWLSVFGWEAEQFMAYMLGGEKLLTRATPAWRLSRLFEFDITGIDERIRPLAEGCGAARLTPEGRASVEAARKAVEAGESATAEWNRLFRECREQRRAEGGDTSAVIAGCMRELPPPPRR